MKDWQFFALFAAIYIAPHLEKDGGLAIGFIFTIFAALLFWSRK